MVWLVHSQSLGFTSPTPLADDVQAAYTVCYILVLFAGTWPADKFGRKPMILLIQVFMAIACLIEMFATTWPHWLAAKMMNVSV